MKNIILIISLIVATFTAATSQSISTNLRVATDGKDKDVALYLYEIEIKEKQINFNCTNCEMDFTLNLTDTISVSDEKSYRIVTKDTDDTDQVNIIYKNGILNSVAIQQINGVTLYYIQSEIKAKDISYKL
jgi:hypothetical protein